MNLIQKILYYEPFRGWPVYSILFYGSVSLVLAYYTLKQFEK